jgi:hypothetical protein
MSYVIVFVELAGQVIDGRMMGKTRPQPGTCLASFDPDAHGGAGIATWTTDRTQAMTFPTPQAAFAYWGTESTVVPLRADGQPNRPLTAFTVMVEPQWADNKEQK